MKVRVEPEWATRGVRVWLYEDDLGGLRLLTLEDGLPIMREVERGSIVPPSFTLPEDALQALVREASALMPPSDATVDALQDARDVRDRLLSLIERGAR